MTSAKFPLALLCAALLAGCGGTSSNSTSTASNSSSGSSTSGNSGSGSTGSSSAPANVLPIVVNNGPSPNGYADGAFTSVTVCAPGSTTNCKTISGILVDTGSYGLRVLASALPANLPQESVSGAQLGECAQFASTFTWGGVVTADLTLGGEKASAVPIEAIAGGGSNITTVPTACQNTGTQNDDLSSLGANGILGVGLAVPDCGDCNTSTAAGFYYGCSAPGTCNPTTVPYTMQVSNPVFFFKQDNNGLIVQLPSVPSTGSSTVAGSLIFGLGTQANNSISSPTILNVDSSGNFIVAYSGKQYSQSFIDSGSNGYFLDNSSLNLATCKGKFTGGQNWFCPPSTVNLNIITQSAVTTINGGTSTPGNATISIASADTLFNSGGDAFNDIGGPGQSGAFDLGLPFFFGRSVAVAIDGQSTPYGTGPFVAY